MNLDLVSFLYLPLIFYVGLVASIEDWKTQKIRNQLLRQGYWSGLAVLIFLFAWSRLLSPDSFFYVSLLNDLPLPDFMFSTVQNNFFLKTFLNSLCALVLGFLLWKYRIMAAGDAKLFALFAWLLPTTYYWKTYLPVFPAFALLVNIFFVVLVVFIWRAWYFLVKNFKLATTEIVGYLRSVQLKSLFSVASIKKLQARMWVIYSILFVFLTIKNIIIYTGYVPGGQFLLLQGYLMAFFIIFRSAIVVFLQKDKIRELFLVLLALNLILSFLDSPAGLSAYLWQLLLIMLFFLLIFDGLLKLVNFYMQHSAVRLVAVSDLKTGDIISDRVVERLKKEKIIFHNYVGRIFPRGLAPNELTTIREWAEKKGLQQLGIYEHFPFAFWIFVGVLTTIVFQGSILNIVLNSFWRIV